MKSTVYIAKLPKSGGRAARLPWGLDPLRGMRAAGPSATVPGAVTRQSDTS